MMNTKKRNYSPNSFTFNERITLSIYLLIIVSAIAFAAYKARSIIFRPWTIRDDMVSIFVDGMIYVFGGRNSDGKMLDDVLRINTEKKSLRTFTNLPTLNSSMGVVHLNNTVYLLGGFNGNTSSNSIITCNLKNKKNTQWGYLPEPIAFGAAGVWNNAIYHFGGWNDSSISSQIIKIDPMSNKATIVGSLPMAREYFSASFFKDRLYLIGGEDDQYNDLHEITEIEPVSWKVLRTAAFPFCPINTSSALCNGKIYVVSGWNFKTNNKVIEVDPSGEEIVLTVIGQLPEKISTPNLVSDNKNLYIIGGIGDAIGRQIGVVRIDPQTGAMKKVHLSSFVWW